jgi:chemotaxis protein MotB
VIAAELVALGRPLRIEGHTDESKSGNSRFRDSWELSSSRAAAVASYVQRAHDVDPKKLAAVGYGSSRPLSAGKTAAARDANRRVEMVIEFNPQEE